MTTRLDTAKQTLTSALEALDTFRSDGSLEGVEPVYVHHLELFRAYLLEMLASIQDQAIPNPVQKINVWYPIVDSWPLWREGDSTDTLAYIGHMVLAAEYDYFRAVEKAAGRKTSQ
ncbi:MAG: hypothetical protein KA170_11655 [Candidatus Promineofilum sp.]|jgi:hypothetical protein|nr:hypothetical protein [Promineifilum sp.]